MSDIFQIFANSADAAPGKGTGETLISPPETYAELKKIPNWRRLLAKGDTSPLPLTHSAQIWEAGKKNKVRRDDLEKLRDEQQLKPISSKLEQPANYFQLKPSENKQEQTEQMESKATSSKKKPTTKKPVEKEKEQEAPLSSSNMIEAVSHIPASMYSSSSIPQTYDVVVPDLEEQDQESTIHFCPICGYYLYLSTEGPEGQLIRVCNNCSYKKEDAKGGLISEILIQERAAEGYKILLNEFTRTDPRLPHIRGVMKCPDPACESNHGKDSDIIYIKYDAVNLLYLYICDVCGYQWHSRR
jgi:hypothetical protein